MLNLLMTMFAATVQAGGQDSVAETMATYEKIRSLLAADQMEGVSKEAERLAMVAEEAGKGSEGALKDQLRSAALAASALKDAGNLEKARSAFGELSRPIVGALRAEPSLARGRFLYKCPMVKGYGLWVQTAKEVSNPYMGKKMLRCGEPAETR